MRDMFPSAYSSFPRLSEKKEEKKESHEVRTIHRARTETLWVSIMLSTSCGVWDVATFIDSGARSCIFNYRFMIPTLIWSEDHTNRVGKQKEKEPIKIASYAMHRQKTMISHSCVGIMRRMGCCDFHRLRGSSCIY